MEVSQIMGMNIEATGLLHRVSAATVKKFAKKLFYANFVDQDDCPDAIFISCSALPSIQVLQSLEEELEADVGKHIPVLCSNASMFWHTSRAAGYQEPIEKIGKLGYMPLNHSI